MNGRADAVVDITDVVCPITFVKAKVAMEELTAGQILEVKINEGEAVFNVPRSFKEEGHRITRTLNNGDGTYTLLIEKAGLTK
jgi:tRNA 2-thiouridine synthesizing protein A